MPRKTKQELAAEQAAAAQAARPFAFESTASYGAADDEGKDAIGLAIAAAKLAGASGNEMRATFGERLTGPARRDVFLRLAARIDPAFGQPPYIAASYVAYGDSQPRKGSRHAREHGAKAEQRRADARSNAEQALAAAKAAPKGRTKAAKAEHAANVEQAERTLALLLAGTEA